MPGPLITPPNTPQADAGDFDRHGKRPQDLRPDAEPNIADVSRPADRSDKTKTPIREKKI
jgi:hypothetical protein